MPGDSIRPATDELEAVLKAARSAVARGDGWQIEPRHYDRLRADCEALGAGSTELQITKALRTAFSEIAPEQLHKRIDKSYGGLAQGQTLFECSWDSARFEKRCYVKFAMTEEGIEIFTFHVDAGRREGL